ncbi:MAG: hypothetical protein ABGW50_02115 [Thermococcus sp.]
MRPRSFRDMVEKYTAKFDPATIATRFNEVKDIALARYEDAMSVIANVQDEVRNILNEEGVPPALWGPYIAFAEQLAKKSFSFSGAALQKVASGLKAYFVTAHHLDPAILDRIIELVVGEVPTY